MLQIRLVVKASQQEEVSSLLGFGPKSKGNKALQAAISDTVTTGRAMLARRLAEEINLPIADIKDTIYARRGSYDKLEGALGLVQDKAVWLAQFATGWVKKSVAGKLAKGLFKQVQKAGGVTVKVRKRPSGKYGTTQNFPHAFWAVMPKSLHLGIFERVGIKRTMKSGMYEGKVREVIRRKRGPTPLGVFLNARGQDGAEAIVDEVEKKLADALDKNVKSQIDRFMHT